VPSALGQGGKPTSRASANLKLVSNGQPPERDLRFLPANHSQLGGRP